MYTYKDIFFFILYFVVCDTKVDFEVSILFQENCNTIDALYVMLVNKYVLMFYNEVDLIINQ